MKILRNFKIYYTCQFGMAFFHLRAASFEDALSRLSEYHKKISIVFMMMSKMNIIILKIN